MAARSRQATEAVAEIGACPAVVNPDRRAACERDLHGYLVTYFPESTGLRPFSHDHRRIIDRVQRCILGGGRFVNAVYRGFAKTTIAERAMIWAVTFGHREFGLLIGADKGAAENLIDAIKQELESNDLLLEDFPEVCHPARELGGKPQRAATQTSQGERTHIEWTADKIVLPTIAGSVASGAVLRTRGITGGVRGLKHARVDGRNVRPDFVLIDDPQTDASAASVVQTAKRLNTIRRSILKLGGHNTDLAVVMNATVIEPDDLVDQLLDHKRNPSWQAERIPMIRAWSSVHDTLWMEDYARLRNSYDPDLPGDQQRAHRAATAFYRKRRKRMNAGCVVSWEHCYNHETELSAIQHAYNMLIDDGPDVFASECQGRPAAADDATKYVTVSQVAAKLNGLAAGQFPAEVELITAYVDVHDSLLYHESVAWAPRFTGYVLRYGAWPDQRRRHFAMRDARPDLLTVARRETPSADVDAAIVSGLVALWDELFSREWVRDDGAVMFLDVCLTDIGYKPDLVRAALALSPHRGKIWPSAGDGVTAARKPYDEYRQESGRKIGHHWQLPPVKKTKQLRHVLIDTNYWKTFCHQRLAAPIGGVGSVSFAGGDADRHRMIAEQIAKSEYFIPTSGRGRSVDAWAQLPAKPDNHLFDCHVGNHVAASMRGITLPTVAVAAPAKKRPSRKATYL